MDLESLLSNSKLMPLPTRSLDDIVKQYVLSVYGSCKGDKRETAKQLGVSLPELYRMFDGWGVLSEEFRVEWRDHIQPKAVSCPM